MNKKVKLNLDVSISEEKKEMAVAENAKSEVVPEKSENVIIPGSAKKARRKKMFTIGLVIVGMLLSGLSGYGIASYVHGREVTNKEEKGLLGWSDKEDKYEEVDSEGIIDARQDSALEDGIYEYETIDRAQGPQESVTTRIDQFPTDETTRAIIDRGFYYELDTVLQDDIFKLELVGTTGDMYKPVMLLNIYVNDEEIVAQNDKIEVYAYCLGEEAYENEIGHYGQWNAYGEQDPENPHLYHVTLPAGIWLSSGGSVVFDMTTIRLGSQMSPWKTYDVSLKTKLNIPYTQAYFPCWVIDNTGLEFETEAKTYKLYCTNLGYYESSLLFHYDIEDKPGTNNGESNLRQWYRFINEVILEVNGVEYRVDPGNKGYINMSENSDEEFYYVYPVFPGITDDEINSVIVKYGETAYRIK